MKKSVIKTRLFIFCGCLLVGGSCFCALYFGYDPLARYPYGSLQQREQLMAELDSDDIDYLINAQITPEMILPFIEEPGFEIQNTSYYSAAMDIRAAQTNVIVPFVNTYKDRMSLEEMCDWLSWLSYSDIMNYMDSNSSLPLAENPDDPFLILNGNVSVYTYTPDDLTMTLDGILLREEAANAWDELMNGAVESGITMKGQEGFVSYQEQRTMPEYRSFVKGPYGSREEQLGWTVEVNGSGIWNEACSQDSDGNTSTYDMAKAALSQDQQEAMDWLAEHAWEYGYIVRYPQNKTEKTHTLWQPFVLRYVGKEPARTIHDQDLSLEEYVAASAGGNEDES